MAENEKKNCGLRTLMASVKRRIIRAYNSRLVLLLIGKFGEPITAHSRAKPKETPMALITQLNNALMI